MTDYSEQIEGWFTLQMQEMEPKKALILAIARQALQFAGAQGYDPEKFFLSESIYQMAHHDLEEFMSAAASGDGVVMDVLTSEREEDDRILASIQERAAAGKASDEDCNRFLALKWYSVQANFVMDATGKLRMSWAMCRFEGGRTYANVNGVWTPHFIFEGSGDGALKNCDACDKRMKCWHYLDQMEDDEDTGFERTDVTFTDSQKAALEREGEGDLLELVADKEGSVSDGYWEQILSAHGKLVELFKQTRGLLDFVYLGKGRYALSSCDFPDHTGFVIRQKKGQYELCQFADTTAMADAFDLHEEFMREEKDQIYPVALLPVSKIRSFVYHFADRACTGETLFTIPLSEKRAIQLRGAIGRNRALSKRIGKGSGEWSREEADNARHYMEMLSGIQEVEKSF